MKLFLRTLTASGKELVEIEPGIFLRQSISERKSAGTLLSAERRFMRRHGGDDVGDDLELLAGHGSVG
jgi:hypothetical protein